MKVLVDALPLRHGGGVSYLIDQLQALARVAPDLEVRTLVSPWMQRRDELPGQVGVTRVPNVAVRMAYEQTLLPLARADVLYCAANFGPVSGRVPMVLGLHNANYYRSGLALAETRPARPPWKLRANYAAIAHSTVSLAVSESLAADVRASVPRAAGKVQVLHSGAAGWDDVVAEPVPGLPRDYVLVLGSLGAHKRVAVAVEGWRRAVDAVGDAAPELVVAGGLPDAVTAECRAAAGDRADRLHFTGHVQRPQLRTLYENARAMVSMSVLEAFPLAPGEAAALGCPVVLSDIAPHREVTAGAQVSFVPPGDAAALADTLVREVFEATAARTVWRWPWTWEDNARGLADALRAAADRRGRR